MKQTLLIADDDAELADHYEMSLTEHGYAAETASDGLECVKKLRQVTPAALVLDLDLRWGGGDGVLAWLREESLTHEIPVILTATAEYPQDYGKLIKPPVVACLRKPFAVTALLESVRSGVAKTNGRTEPLNRHRFRNLSELSMDDKEELSMDRPTTLSDRSLYTHADEEKDTFQATAALRTQRPEDICLAERIVRFACDRL